MKLYILNFYCARLSVPSQLTRCSHNIVYEVISDLHEQLRQHTTIALQQTVVIILDAYNGVTLLQKCIQY